MSGKFVNLKRWSYTQQIYASSEGRGKQRGKNNWRRRKKRLKMQSFFGRLRSTSSVHKQNSSSAISFSEEDFKLTGSMGTVKVPEPVPSPDNDCQRLKKAFEGFLLLLLSLSDVIQLYDGFIEKVCVFECFVQCWFMGQWWICEYICEDFWFSLWILVD